LVPAGVHGRKDQFPPHTETHKTRTRTNNVSTIQHIQIYSVDDQPLCTLSLLIKKSSNIMNVLFTWGTHAWFAYVPSLLLILLVCYGLLYRVDIW